MKQRLIDTLMVQTTTYKTDRMQKYIIDQYGEISEGNDGNFDIMVEDGNIYITKGKAESYPCVIAHTDTVHAIVENFEIFEHEDHLFSIDTRMWDRVGIGGDDKVGVFVALESLREHDVIKVAFFRDEEHGCIGSGRADMKFFENVEFVLQCDRRGYKDFVRNIMGTVLYDDDFSKALGPILSKYGKKETLNGGLTDVYQLVENGLDVCVANMSCGYYFPHSDEEIVCISEVYKTLALVSEIISELSGTVWTNDDFTPYTRRYQSRYYGGGYWDDFAYDGRDGFKFDDKDDDDDDADFAQPYLDNFCPECAGMDVHYDPSEHADWCYDCDQYVHYYPKDEKGEPIQLPEKAGGVVKVIRVNEEGGWHVVETDSPLENDFLYDEWKDWYEEEV